MQTRRSVYTYPPDDMTMDEWVKLMEGHFIEYYGRKLGGKKPNASSAVPGTPHYLGDRLTAFGRSYRNMRRLDGDYPDFL